MLRVRYSLCGRGTGFPFQVLGPPKMPDTGFSNTLREQIIQGMTVEEINAIWKEEMDQFRETRAKYLLYN